MTEPQILRDKTGVATHAVVPIDDYERLVEAAELAADIAAYDAAKARGDEGFPAELLDRLDSGVHPARVFREHRGLSGVELARRVGISSGYLSQIETGRREGAAHLLAAIARALDIDLELLFPPNMTGDVGGPRNEGVLPDILEPNLDLLICGYKVGKKSAEAGHYYSDSRNRFWRTLHWAGLTTRELFPEQDLELLSYGVGLTDLMKTSIDTDVSVATDADRQRLRDVVDHYRPRILAFLGRNPAEGFLERKKNLEWGLLPDRLDPTRLVLVPDTSGGNRHFEKLRKHWRDLGRTVQGMRGP